MLGLLWQMHSGSVGEVVQAMNSSLAYTTVMTTLDRLYKKGLLLRDKRDRAFIYRPAVTSEQMETGRATSLIQRFFGDSNANQDVLVSCLIEAVDGYDADLLDRLEEKIRLARERAANEAADEQGRR